MTEARFEAHVKHFNEARNGFERKMIAMEESITILEQTCRVLRDRIQRLECPEPPYSSVSGPQTPVIPDLPAIFIRKKPL